MTASLEKSSQRVSVGWKRPIVMLALIALPALFVLDTVIATQRGYSGGKATRMLFIAMLATTALLLLMNLVPRLRSWFDRYCARLLLMSAAIVVALVVAESALRVVRDRAPFHLRKAGLRTVFHPNPEFVPGVSPVANFHINSLGVRGTEPPARAKAYRILCVGGSTTECLYLDNLETWPAQLMDTLNESLSSEDVWVGNAGMAGYDSAHHLRLIRDRDFISHFDCLVLLVGVNDLGRTLRGGAPGEETMYPLWRKTECAALAYELLLGGVYHDNVGEVYASQRLQRRAGVKADDTPDLTAGLVAYRKTIRAIVEACRESGIRCVLVTQPVLWDANMSEATSQLLWLGDLDDGRYLKPAPLRDAMNVFNNALREVARSTDTELVDVAPVSGKVEYFADDCHFTTAGAREMARLIAAHFRTHPHLLARPSPSAAGDVRSIARRKDGEATP